MSTLDERRTDALLLFYADVVEEIRRLDPDNVAHVREVYDARVAVLDGWRKKNEIWAELDGYTVTSDYKRAIERIAEALPTIADDDERSRLEKWGGRSIWNGTSNTTRHW